MYQAHIAELEKQLQEAQKSLIRLGAQQVINSGGFQMNNAQLQGKPH